MPNGKDGSSTLRVEVRDVRGETIGDASVAVVPRDPRAERVELRFDDETGTYASASLAGGHADLEVQHERLEGQKREVQIGEGLNHELFILGEPGMRTYFREKVRVPVDADPDLIGVTLVRQGRQDTNLLDTLMDGLELELQEVPDLARRAGVALFRSGGTDVGGVLERLSEHPLVEHAGAVVGVREEGFSHLTREVVVRFRGPRIEEVRQIAKELGYTVVRDLVYAPGTYVLRWNGPASLDILDSIEQLAQRDDVEWAEPSLVVTPEVDAVVPTEATWAGLWDRQLIGLADAWQHLQDAGLDTFGDPDIVLAVWDSGVQSVGGVPTNEDFAGTLSDGSPKVFATFDFENMVANNNTPWDNHGSGVAGGASARANNASPVAGESYGVVGSAPNVKIMTIAGRLPYIDIEVADQYIWMAGFDPQSPIAGFPARLTRGADVITCSLTPGAGAPLSGTARATLDFVTTFGRGGKGTLCFFSTGNANQNNVTARPYGAYEKCFGIAGTSLGDDGVTEVRAPFSGWGQIALCSPTQDTTGNIHNPPGSYKPWSAHHAGAGNLISFRQTQTTMTAASAAGATTLGVASVAGFAVNAVIQVGAFGTAGSEPARVTAVNAVTNQLTVTGWSTSGFSGGLVNAHAAGSAVMTGPANHRNDFGGTSYSTPLAAGVAALVLSANPALTFVEAREVLRMTAVKFDLANTDPVGRWLDANGNPSTTSGQPPVRSGWYGYGRVNAAAAVQTALTFAQTRDLVIRDNLADVGAVASSGTFWNSPDIWCRRLDPAMDPGALPANYTTQGPHEDPMRGQQNWVYARIRNNGSQASLDAWVRISVTHYPGMEFTYPESWQPAQGPGDPIPSPMTPGTYFIGEAKVTNLAPGANTIVSIPWPVGLIPPEDVATPSGNVHWHPCLLAEITPHDGPVATGNHVWDDNNLAQKNISIVGTDAGSDFAVANVVGNEQNDADFLTLEVNRGRLPAGVQLFVDLMDPLLRRRLRALEQQGGTWPIPKIPIEGIPRPPRPIPIPTGAGTSTAAAIKIPQIPKLPWPFPRRRSWKIGLHDGREVAFLNAVPRAQVPVFAGPGRLSPVIVGGIVGSDVEPGEYEIVLVQRLPSGEISGSATISLAIGQG